MSGWHRDNPELVGTDADPWMGNAGHAEAALAARQVAAGFSDAWIAEMEARALTFECEACGGEVHTPWNGRDYLGDCAGCGLTYEYDPDPPGALHVRKPHEEAHHGNDR